MKKWYLSLCIALCLPATIFAYTLDDVSEWTERTLMSTLIAGHHETVSEAANVHNQFKIQAWRPMQTFFDRHLEITREQLVKLQPEPVMPAVIVAPEDCEEASCWWVYQAFLIPELRKKINFTALVATADAAHSSPLIIHRLDVVVSPY